MCSILGFIGTSQNRVTGHVLSDLKRMATLNERRGPHAFGFAWIDARGRLRSYKQTGRVTRNLDQLNMVRDARAAIIHTRYATHGDYTEQANNHPHPCDGGWLIHNGVVCNHESLNARYDLAPTSDCDSETIARLVENLDGTTLERCVEAVDLTTGDATIAAIWTRPMRVVVVRRGNPLSLSTTSAGTFFASLGAALPGKRLDFPNELAHEFTERNRDVKILTQQTRVARPKRTASIHRFRTCKPDRSCVHA